MSFFTSSPSRLLVASTGYANDYDIVGRMKQFADKNGVCLLLVHHTRKQQAGDKFEMISGTTGLLGCADGAFLLQKEKRTDLNATLEIVGRDQPDQKLHLTRDAEKLTWQLNHAETELWKKPPDPLLSKLAAVIAGDTPVWNGSATELVALLGEDIQPNILTRRLNVKAGELLNEYSIEYTVKQFSRLDIEPASQNVRLYILAKQCYKLCCAAVPYGGISGNHGCEFAQQRVGRFLPKLSFRMIELPCQLLGIPRQMELLIRLISADDFKGGVQVGALFLLQKKCPIRTAKQSCCAGDHFKFVSSLLLACVMHQEQAHTIFVSKLLHPAHDVINSLA